MGENLIRYQLCLLQEKPMQKKKPLFSTMEIVVFSILVGSLILSFIQARQEENQQK